MGKIENEVRLSNRKRLIQRAILGTLAVGGLLTIAAIAPNCLQLLALFGGPTRKKDLFRNSLYRSRDSLLEKGYISSTSVGTAKKLQITEKGKRYLQQLEGKSY